MNWKTMPECARSVVSELGYSLLFAITVYTVGDSEESTSYHNL